MKKTISILLALTMIFALCVPAFATVGVGSINQVGATSGATQNGTGTVKTTRSDATTNPDGTYSVSFPAELALTWGTASTDFQYTITSQLVAGKRLNVTMTPVSSAATPFMSLGATGKTLPYSITETTTNAKDYTTSTEVVDAQQIDFAIAVADWSVAFGDYTDTLTFAVKTVDAP